MMFDLIRKNRRLLVAGCTALFFSMASTILYADEIRCDDLIPIVATVSGSALSPIPVPRPESVQNGGFFITAGSHGMVGNGINETTMWIFDFLRVPGFRDFRRVMPDLASARLTLTMIPGHGSFANDQLRIPGVGTMRPKAARHLTVGVSGTIEIELLDHFDSSDILEELLVQRGRSHVPVIYRDDALIESATLELVPLCTPEQP